MASNRTAVRRFNSIQWFRWCSNQITYIHHFARGQNHLPLDPEQRSNNSSNLRKNSQRQRRRRKPEIPSALRNRFQRRKCHWLSYTRGKSELRESFPLLPERLRHWSPFKTCERVPAKTPWVWAERIRGIHEVKRSIDGLSKRNHKKNNRGESTHSRNHIGRVNRWSKTNRWTIHQRFQGCRHEAVLYGLTRDTRVLRPR